MAVEDASLLLDRPFRTCVGCRRRHPQRCLVRFAVAGTTIVVDARQRLPGRGAYLCHQTQCATATLGDPRPLLRALRVGGNRVTADGRELLTHWQSTVREQQHSGETSTSGQSDGECRAVPARGTRSQEMARE